MPFFGPSRQDVSRKLSDEIQARVIKDIDRLKLVFELFAETLDQLTRMVAADTRPARVDLK